MEAGFVGLRAPVHLVPLADAVVEAAFGTAFGAGTTGFSDDPPTQSDATAVDAVVTALTGAFTLTGPEDGPVDGQDGVAQIDVVLAFGTAPATDSGTVEPGCFSTLAVAAVAAVPGLPSLVSGVDVLTGSGATLADSSVF